VAGEPARPGNYRPADARQGRPRYIFEPVSMDPSVKMIAMTGGGWKEAVDRLHDARLFGAARTVSKPFTVSEMVRVVGEVLSS